jgi:hypothetical protein
MTKNSSDEKSLHVVPIGDLREHKASGDCWCVPVKDEHDNVYVHKPLDQRDLYESGKLKLH